MGRHRRVRWSLLAVVVAVGGVGLIVGLAVLFTTAPRADVVPRAPVPPATTPTPATSSTPAAMATVSYRVTRSTALDIAHLDARGAFRDLGIVRTPYAWSAPVPAALAGRAKVIAVCPDATAWVTCTIAVNGTVVSRSAGDGRAVCGPR